ncbi:MAG: sigma-54-dependent transcriptional regulator [bacterium]
MRENRRALLIDDDTTALELIKDLLEPKGLQVHLADSVDRAIEQLTYNSYQVVVTDLKMPGRSGMDMLDYCRVHFSEIPVVILTGHATVPSAVEALKKGAFDYISKPIQIDELELVINKAISHEKLKAQNTFLKQELEKRDELLYDTCSPELQRVYETIHNLHDINSTVLLSGESGTGKEVVARLIHRSSSRASGSFVPINCGAIPEHLIESELFGYEKGAFTDAKQRTKGKLEVADGGTLFLDEINELPVKAQVSLLRFIQERVVVPLGSNRQVHVDVRIIAASNKDLAQRVRSGEFREDLFYRINVIPLTLPPLRRRTEDIIPLAEWFLRKFDREYNRPVRSLTPAAKSALRNYDWPGNIRELRNCIERASIITNSESLEPADLFLPGPDSDPQAAQAHCRGCFQDLGIIPLKQLEEEYIRYVVQKLGGNKSRAAEQLGVSVRGLRYKLNNEADSQ